MVRDIGKAIVSGPSVNVRPRRCCRDSVDILMEGSDPSMSELMSIPTSSRGSSAAATHPLRAEPDQETSQHDAYRFDAELTSGKEIPSLRISYRYGQNIDLDYGPNVDVNSVLPSSYALPSDVVNILNRCTTRCYKCNHRIDLQKDGFSFAKTFIPKCTNKHCDFDRSFRVMGEKIGNFFVKNLCPVYTSLVNDVFVLDYQG